MFARSRDILNACPERQEKVRAQQMLKGLNNHTVMKNYPILGATNG
jgi:hypothetical protein